MKLKTKSKILSIITKILAFITIIFFIYIFICYLSKNNFLLCSLSFIVLLLLCELTFILSDAIFDENYFYEHCLKATSEKTLLKKGFEYAVASLNLDFYIDSIEIGGEKVNYSEDKKNFKKMLEQNDKVTVFCYLINEDYWTFHWLPDEESRDSREQLVSFELPSKKILKKIKKKKKPCIDHEINAVCIRNKYALYPNFVFIPQNIASDPDCRKLLKQIIKDGDPMTFARAILSEDVPHLAKRLLPKNTQSNYAVRRGSYTVRFEDAWNPLVFSGNGCGLVCFQEAGCKCCITPDCQRDSSDTCTKTLKQTHEVYFDDKTKNRLIDRIEIIDQKLQDGFLFRNIHASKWERGYKDQVLNALNSPYPLDAKTAEMFEKVIEELEENLYDAKKEAEDLDRECTAKALKDMLIMDGIQTNTLSKNEVMLQMRNDGLDKYRVEYNNMLLDKMTGAKNDFCN